MAPLVDFSPLGLAVKTPRVVKNGAVFRLAIQVGSDYFRAAAITRRKYPTGFAVEFLSMGAIDRQTMGRLYLRLQMAAREAREAPEV